MTWSPDTNLAEMFGEEMEPKGASKTFNITISGGACLESVPLTSARTHTHTHTHTWPTDQA